MCNVRYEYRINNNNSNATNSIDNSLLEKAFNHEYMDNLGFCYKCKLCDAVFKSSLDAWLHLKNYHNIKTLNDYLAYEELKKTMNETKQEEQKQEEERQGQNDKTIIKKVAKPKQKTLLHFFFNN